LLTEHRHHRGVDVHRERGELCKLYGTYSLRGDERFEVLEVPRAEAAQIVVEDIDAGDDPARQMGKKRVGGQVLEIEAITVLPTLTEPLGKRSSAIAKVVQGRVGGKPSAAASA
jgi:hypothetical protein